MPKAPRRYCSVNACPNYAERGGRCSQHNAERNRAYNKQRRGTTASLGYNSKWQKARKDFLRANPFCEHCLKQGMHVPAVEIDHKTPAGADALLFWDMEGNWQALCRSCHSRKTVRENGGFGNAKRPGA